MSDARKDLVVPDDMAEAFSRIASALGQHMDTVMLGALRAYLAREGYDILNDAVGIAAVERNETVSREEAAKRIDAAIDRGRRRRTFPEQWVDLSEYGLKATLCAGPNHEFIVISGDIGSPEAKASYKFGFRIHPRNPTILYMVSESSGSRGYFNIASRRFNDAFPRMEIVDFDEALHFRDVSQERRPGDEAGFDLQH